MFNALVPTAYIRLRFGWISVRLIRQGELVGAFEGKAQVALKRMTASTIPEVVAVGDEVESALARSSEEIVVRTAFDHPRLLFGSVENTVLVMKHFVLRAAQQADISLRGCRVVLHPQRELEGGLSELEAKGLIELATRAGGRDVGIYNGAAELTPLDLSALRLKKPLNRS
jgi:rod shape-determining protein MreB